MGKVIRGVISTVIAASFLAPVAGAEECGTISNTGPGSTNEIECEINTSSKFICKNNIWVANENYQQAGSGGAVVGGNTTGGNATSGDATNNNNTDVTVGTSCGLGATGGNPVTPSANPNPAPTPAPTPVPVTPKAAGGAGAALPSALPRTSGNNLAIPVIASVLTLASGLAISRLALATFRRSL